MVVTEQTKEPITKRVTQAGARSSEQMTNRWLAATQITKVISK